MIRFSCASVLVAASCLPFVACLGPSHWARLTPGGRYEVYNPTPCMGQIFTATEENVTRRFLGRVPSGGRAVLTVPPGSEGTRVVGMALYPDGTNCEVGTQIRIRRVRS
jgi:hypothetical protein